jgi:hypothetical protein
MDAMKGMLVRIKASGKDCMKNTSIGAPAALARRGRAGLCLVNDNVNFLYIS